MDEEGNTAVFWIGTKAGKITSAGYRCTTCFTLLALCEHVCEMLAGSAVEDVLEITPARLLSLHPEIPSERHGRARLAVEAVRSALKRHTKIGGVLV